VIAAYVSSHGFGHATRTGEVLRALRERAPSLPITVVSATAEGLFRQAVPAPFAHRAAAFDVGLVQKGALTIDEPGSLARLDELEAGAEALVVGESQWLVRSGARVVLADIPALPFAAARRAGLPSVGLANFSWDWIYRHLALRVPAFGAHAERFASRYAQADLLLELPFAGDLSAFPRRRRIPLLARRPRVARDEVRRRLGLGAETIVLWSFGGLGLPGFDPTVFGRHPRSTFLVPEADPRLPGNARALDWGAMAGLGLVYPDLVGASDVVVTKPGYGIVSDAIGAGTPLVYTDRGDFPEYPLLVRGMEEWLPCLHVSNEDLLRGRFGEAVDAVRRRPLGPRPDLGGAEAAAQALLDLAGAAPSPLRGSPSPSGV
jgi:L-arabinokinase